VNAIVATQTYSGQVTEYEWSIMHATFICREFTTVREVVEWAKKNNQGHIGISLDLTEDATPKGEAKP